MPVTTFGEEAQNTKPGASKPEHFRIRQLEWAYQTKN